MFKFVKVICLAAIACTSISLYVAFTEAPNVAATVVPEENGKLILGHRMTKFGQYQLVTKDQP